MFHILTEGERLALFKGGRYRTLRGPGIILYSPFGGERVRLRIGQVVTVASEGEVIVRGRRIPAQIERAAGGWLKIVGFDEASVPARLVVAEAESDSPSRQPPSRRPKSSVRARPTGAKFWVGLVVVLGFASVCLGGGMWALDRVLLQYSLDERGQVASGEILRKEGKEEIRGVPGGNTQDTVYEITYRFRVGAKTVIGTERTDPRQFFDAHPGDAIRIRYLPDDPSRNRPQGYSLTAGDWVGTGLGLVAGVFFLIVAVGMIVTRIRKPVSPGG
jgi:hypothetical protein